MNLMAKIQFETMSGFTENDTISVITKVFSIHILL